MSLTTPAELLLLIVIFLPYLAVRRYFHASYLLLVSIAVVTFFYPLPSLILFFLTLWVYLLGVALHRVARGKKALLVAGLLVPVVLLAIYKYPPVYARVAPLLSLPPTPLAFTGISYFTFKFWHYLVDIYRGKTVPARLRDFLLYIYFFPTYLAGPIERIQHFRENIYRPLPPVNENIAAGLERIVQGLFKKLVLAAYLGDFVQLIYSKADRSPWFLLWAAVYAYSLQIYFDFSGYTDIAIGTARLFGYDIMENFNRPYLQENIADFWRNWHMTLTGWLREYVFYPVRQGLSRLFMGKYESLAAFLARVINMIVCGIWHGSGWNFLLWGLYHGLGLGFYRLHSNNPEIKALWERLPFAPRLRRYLSIFLTFNFVSLGWVLFSNDLSRAKIILSRLLGLQYKPFLLLYGTIALLYLDLVLFKSRYRKVVIVTCLILAILLLKQDVKTPEFIYQNF